MSKDAETIKSADQILDEIFSTLVAHTHSSRSETEVPANSQQQPPLPASIAELDVKEVAETKSKKKKKEMKSKKKKKRKEKENEGGKKKEKKKKKKSADDDAESGNKIKTPASKKTRIELSDNKVPGSRDGKTSSTSLSPRTKEETRELKSQSIESKKCESNIKEETKQEEKGRKETTEQHKSERKGRNDVREPHRKHSPSRKSTPPRRSSPSRRRRSPINERRRRSRSRTPPRRKRSRSPVHRRHGQTSRSRSRSPRRTRRNSKSPIILHRSRPSSQSPDEKIDKTKLLEIAKQNLKRMQETGKLPVNLSAPIAFVPSMAAPDDRSQAAPKSTGKTVAELTDYCKHLVETGQSGSDEAADSTKPDGQTFTRHPFQIKPRTDTIVMNIRNAVPLPVRKPEERPTTHSQLKQQFPVSSGQQHLDLEWVPVPPPAPVPPVGGGKESSTNKTAKVAPVPRVSLPVPEPPPVDIGSILAKRLSSIKKLQANQSDVQARTELEETEAMTQNWAMYHHTNPMTGEPMPELINWSGAPQSWVRRDQFSSAAPVAGGVGMKLLQKMGWQPGEGLGRNKEGTLEPLALDIKMDKKGLVSKEELAPNRTTAAVKIIQDFQGKHPVSILHELCTKKRWEPPIFDQVAAHGPDHLKHFLFKVTVNGVDYLPCLPSTTKKDAKAQSAAVCLTTLGILFPPT